MQRTGTTFQDAIGLLRSGTLSISAMLDLIDAELLSGTSSSALMQWLSEAEHEGPLPDTVPSTLLSRLVAQNALPAKDTAPEDATVAMRGNSDEPAAASQPPQP